MKAFVSKTRNKLKETSKRIRETGDKIKNIDYSRFYDAGLGFWILMLLIFFSVLLFAVYVKQIIALFISDFGYLGIFIVSFITDLLVQPIGPDLPLVFGVFAGLNPWIVLVFVLLGSYVALLSAYYIGKTIGSAGIEKIVGKKVFFSLQKYETGSKWFMFIGALTPIPYIPYLAGLWRFSFIDTIIFVAVPRTIRFAVVLLFAYYLGIVLV
ncbi:MAG: hypothetical protein QXK76_02470 [Candidatus Woesearchaeota archaeon]